MSDGRISILGDFTTDIHGANFTVNLQPNISGILAYSRRDIVVEAAQMIPDNN